LCGVVLEYALWQALDEVSFAYLGVGVEVGSAGPAENLPRVCCWHASKCVCPTEVARTTGSRQIRDPSNGCDDTASRQDNRVLSIYRQVFSAVLVQH